MSELLSLRPRQEYAWDDFSDHFPDGKHYILSWVTQADENGFPTHVQFLASYRRLGWAIKRASQECGSTPENAHIYSIPNQPDFHLMTIALYKRPIPQVEE